MCCGATKKKSEQFGPDFKGMAAIAVRGRQLSGLVERFGDFHLERLSDLGHDVLVSVRD